MSIYFGDDVINVPLTNVEGGPVEDADGEVGYSVFVNTSGLPQEVIFTEDELVQMLNEIRAEFGAPEERDEDWED